MSGLSVQGNKNLTYWMDTMDFQEGFGPIQNVSINLLTESYASYPNGKWYPLSVGCLGLGAPGAVNQTFTNGPDQPSINASLVPGNLLARGRIDTNSYGMHIGSVSPKIPGSLHFGGYDQNRVVGGVLTLPTSDEYRREITLKDVAIRVVDGSSPWSFKAAQDGLLGKGNSSIGSQGLQVLIDGCSPYLSLPRSTCDAIAQHLPVTHDAELGLYLWNTEDAKYSQIVSSASALEFTFLGSSNTDKVPISVPFRHLNLTLDQPLVQSPRPYLPCFTGSDKFTLGRTFLQDAFMGADWSARTWFLAQAPGPNVPSSNVVKFVTGGGGTKPVTASSNDWKESWKGAWRALTPAEASSSTESVAPPADGPHPTNSKHDNNTHESSGLSTGAKAGLGIGVSAGALALMAAGALIWSRRQKVKKGAAEGSNFDSIHNHISHNDYAGGAPSYQQPYSKTDGSGPYHPPAHSSTVDGGTDARYSSPNNQYAIQSYTSELPGGTYTAPSELPATPRPHAGPGSTS